MEFTAKQIASFLSGEIEGNPEVAVHTFSKIEEGVAGALSFLANPKYTPYLYTTQSSIVLVNKDFVAEQPVSATLIRVEDAYQSIAMLLQMVEKSRVVVKTGIEQPSVVDPSAELGSGLYIGAFTVVGAGSRIGDNTALHQQVYIGNNVQIGKNCILYQGSKVMDGCVLGDNCILQPGAVIGSEGFGFAPQQSGDYQKIPQIGNVILENNVEIGANTTIDRATMGSTIIRQGVKLDNLIQVGHNVEIGKNTVIAAQTGIAGSTKIGSNCMVGGQVGFAGHIRIADGVQIGAQSGVPNSLTDNTVPYLGYPAMNSRLFARATAVFKKLPEMNVEVGKLRKEIDNLKK